MVEANPQNFADVLMLCNGMGTGKPGGCNILVDQEVETRIEQMKRQSPVAAKMAANGLQRFSLQVDRQEMLKGAEGNKNEAETPAQIQLAHVLIDQDQTVLHGSRKACGLTPGDRQHSVGEISAGHV